MWLEVQVACRISGAQIRPEKPLLTTPMTYVLYTLSPWVLVRNGSFALSLTLPTVLYGIFRFLYLVHRRDEGGEPSRLFVTDTGLLINGVVWLAVTCFAVHAPPEWLPWWWIEL